MRKIALSVLVIASSGGYVWQQARSLPPSETVADSTLLDPAPDAAPVIPATLGRAVAGAPPQVPPPLALSPVHAPLPQTLAIPPPAGYEADDDEEDDGPPPKRVAKLNASSAPLQPAAAVPSLTQSSSQSSVANMEPPAPRLRPGRRIIDFGRLAGTQGSSVDEVAMSPAAVPAI